MTTHDNPVRNIQEKPKRYNFTVQDMFDFLEKVQDFKQTNIEDRLEMILQRMANKLERVIYKKASEESSLWFKKKMKKNEKRMEDLSNKFNPKALSIENKFPSINTDIQIQELNLKCLQLNPNDPNDAETLSFYMKRIHELQKERNSIIIKTF